MGWLSLMVVFVVAIKLAMSWRDAAGGRWRRLLAGRNFLCLQTYTL